MDDHSDVQPLVGEGSHSSKRKTLKKIVAKASSTTRDEFSEFDPCVYTVLPKKDINFDNDDPVVSVQCRCTSVPMSLLWWVCVILSGGFLWLVGLWFPLMRCRWITRPHMLQNATVVIVTRQSGEQAIETLDTLRAQQRTVLAMHEGGSPAPNPSPIVAFTHQNIMYTFDVSTLQFERLTGLEYNMPMETLTKITRKNFKGFSINKNLAGANNIDVPVKSYTKLLFEEVLSPFYLFQFFAVLLWCLGEEYYYYAGCILLASLISIVLTLRETMKNAQSLAKMVHADFTVTKIVRASGKTQEPVHVDALTPGDLFLVHDGDDVPCDALIVTGGCVVNEAMLTGESVPETKVPFVLDDDHRHETYSVAKHKAHTIFRGTTVLQTRTPAVLAMALRTGFNTTKGQLIRSIIFPKPTQFKFYQDGLRFVMVLSIIAVAGFIYTAIVLNMRDVAIGKIISRGLDIITTVVPPALPAAMTIGTMYSIMRLKKQKIICVSPPRVNVGGKVKLCCFDKTGTLTEDGLRLAGINPVANAQFSGSTHVLSQELMGPLSLEHAFATCHSLSLNRAPLNVGQGDQEEDTDSGQGSESEMSTDAQRASMNRMAEAYHQKQALVGDPLEEQLFEVANWHLIEATEAEDDEEGQHQGHHGVRSKQVLTNMEAPAVAAHFTYVTRRQAVSLTTKGTSATAPSTGVRGLAIIKHYAFSSHQQRMTVLVGTATKDTPAQRGAIYCYVKGSPERLLDMCDPATVPPDFEAVLRDYARAGMRVLAVAGKVVEAPGWAQAKDMSRSSIESNLVLLGLTLFENTVKPATLSVIQELHQANIRTLMITGDNMLTAASVAKECEMIPEGTPLTMAVVRSSEPGQWELSLVEVEGEAPVEPGSEPLGLRFTKFSKLAGQPAASTWRKKKAPKFAIGITGHNFALLREHLPDEYTKLIAAATVFARMLPDQKTELVEDLMELGYGVAMCGDGANDCGALKAAHVGVSLSSADASVAAPFTSRDPNISCIPTVIKEGRCALVTSFSCFKFMAMYSFIEFISVLIVYWFESNLGDWQYLYVDMFVILSLAITMGRTKPTTRLGKARPAGSLVAPGILASLLAHIVINGTVQAITLFIMMKQPYYVRHDPHADDEIRAYENTAVFLVANFQYVWVSLAFSIGKPFRQVFYSNYPYLATVLILVGLQIFMVLVPGGWLGNRVLELMDITGTRFAWYVLIIAAINFVITYLFETVFIANDAVRDFFSRFRGKRHYKNKYKDVGKEIIQTSWLQASVAAHEVVSIQ
eukprot:m.223966 g.223966  ORF g.223966 m.223966 type:complete len:1274 (-) comp15146_c0_seq2:2266-6087(-)